MGLLDNTTQYEYYTEGDHGGYQFISLEEIVNQFLIAYVGEEKIISKVKRTDVAFHAQRALRELSFDTFKSIKSQEIELPPSLTMVLPHDYVNYTKISWSDSAGIKHPLYSTKDTSNPFKIRQNSDGTYYFHGDTLQYNLPNYDFASSLSSTTNWSHTPVPNKPVVDDINTNNAKLNFTHGSKALVGSISSRAYAVWQKVNVSGLDQIDLSATGLSAAASSGVKDAGILRVGFTSSLSVNGWDPNQQNPNLSIWSGGQTPQNIGLDPRSRNHLTDIFNIPTTAGGGSYIEFSDGASTSSTKSLSDDSENGLALVSEYDEIYIVITSYIPNYTTAWTSSNNNESTNTVDDIVVSYDGIIPDLQTDGDSTTWSNYKSQTPNENVNPEIYSYDTDIYDFNIGERYGLDPQHAQVNGSFYIDNLKGLIHFSSNISGKTVILDYISDSLGTDGEMQVHKFAEDAMYKWIMYAVLSTRANTPEYIVRRYQKEKFAATRQAKLRLSNIKLEELTQILRGKSKHIKH